jgi:hypothetical protein
LHRTIDLNAAPAATAAIYKAAKPKPHYPPPAPNARGRG